jgi:hypothetical protein
MTRHILFRVGDSLAEARTALRIDVRDDAGEAIAFLNSAYGIAAKRESLT